MFIGQQITCGSRWGSRYLDDSELNAVHLLDISPRAIDLGDLLRAGEAMTNDDFEHHGPIQYVATYSGGLPKFSRLQNTVGL